MSARDTTALKLSRHDKRHESSAVTRAQNTNASKTKPTTINTRTIIDEGTFRIPYGGTLPSTIQRVIDVDGTIGFEGHNRLPVSGAHGIGQLFLRTFNRQQLWLKCCFGKFLFGHNAAGYTELPRAVKRVLMLTKKYVEGTLKQPWQMPTKEEVSLDGVSLTRHLEFESEEEASRAVDQVQRAAASRGILSLAYMPGETITITQNRRVYSATFYVKSKELRASTAASRNPQASEILAAVDGHLRVEIRLTPAALRKFDIATLDCWKDGTADRVFDEVFDDFAFLSLQPLAINPIAEDQDMPKPLQRAVALVRSGTSLDVAYAPSSARRLVNQAAEYGIDLRAPLTPSEAKVVSLNPEHRWVTTVTDEIRRIPGFDRQFGKVKES